MPFSRRVLLFGSCCLLLVPALAGCFRSSETAAPQAEDLGTGLEPFDPPPLADVLANNRWVDMPVVDPMKLLRDKQAAENPLATTAEALKLKNDSKESNEKILSALGRLPDEDADVNWDGSFTRHFLGDVKNMNPILASTTEEFDMLTLLGMEMFGFDWNLKPFAIADFIESWQASDDGLVDKVVLRDDLTWSDGKPITAHDVQFSFETIMNPNVPVPAVRSGTDQIKAVIAYDDHTIIYFHKNALATNVWNVNFPTIPKHVFEHTLKEDYTLTTSPAHRAFEENPVSGGPYVLSQRTKNQEIVLERRESFYMHDGKQVRPKPYFKTMRFLVIQEPTTALLSLKKGDLDEMVITAEQWTTQTDDDDFYKHNTKVRGVEWGFAYFGWNQHSPFFDDLKVRQAMSYAMDYKEMLDKLTYGLYEPCSGIFHPTAWMYPQGATEPYRQDLKKAGELLDAAGWKDHDGDGVRDKEINGKTVRFEFSLLTTPIPTAVAICTLMKESLEKIGVVCDVQRVERTVLQERTLEHRFDAFMGGWGTGADPSTIDNIWETGAKRNFGFYSNPEVDRLLDEAEKTFGREKQAELYGKIHTLIYEDQPYTFLYFRGSFYAFNKQLRGYMFSPRGPYHYNPGLMSIWRVKSS